MTEPLIDKDGNVVEYEEETGGVFITLKKSGKRRNIGRFYRGMLYVKRNLTQHEFRKNQSIGFNYDLMHRGKFTHIILDTGTEFFRITRQEVLDKGEVLNFKKQGFELQIFVPMSHFIKTQ